MWSQVAVLFVGCSLLILGTATAAAGTGSASSLPSYPVFGTKRYTRGNVIPAGEYGGGQVGALALPVYHHPARYYEPQLPQQYFPFAPYQPTTDYYDDLGYYGGNDGATSFYYRPPPPPPQLPHRRYQRNNERYTSYGLPTYRGEYKPTPYYYSHGPSYSYSDEHESSNPLDDLHEEMLQEDERERARDYYPVGQEQWYESPSRPDSTFLRNLILYNQQLQSFAGRGKAPQSPPPPPQLYPDSSAEEDFDEYDEPEPDYEYDTEPSAGFRDSYGYGAGDPGYGPTTNRNAFSKLSSLRNSMARNRLEDEEEDDDAEDDEDDEEVQELKSLIHHQQKATASQQRLPPMFVDRMAPFVLKNQQPPPAPPPPMVTTSASGPVHQKQQSIQQQQRDLLEEQRKQKEQLEQAKKQQLLERQQKLLRTLSSDYQPPAPPVAPEPWQRDSPSYGAGPAAASYGDYDTEYDEDDDDSWSHWDRKRNVQPKKATFASKSTPPVSTTAKPGKELPSGTTPNPTTTDKPGAQHQHPVGNGQKEVVLPRPTSPRNAFAASLLSAVQAPQDGGDGVLKMDEASKLKQIKSSKIYDTLKAMITMRQNLEDADLRQQLEHQKQLAHIHKRFVSNEESLVQQLDGLKRSA
ncbi:uncharacterized protein LOC131208114 [Anopheles bellator]|uniref:uncharacterized protein LOC131208114 n=1 Tax=Anopheles bellator TaxID=139047 RepID=UPI002647A314|nr:uncharacterized protein LOC131208114 [Anopheles bellator]